MGFPLLRPLSGIVNKIPNLGGGGLLGLPLPGPGGLQGIFKRGSGGWADLPGTTGGTMGQPGRYTMDEKPPSGHWPWEFPMPQPGRGGMGGNIGMLSQLIPLLMQLFNRGGR